MLDVSTYLHTRVFSNNYPLKYKRRTKLKALCFTLLEGNLHYLNQYKVLKCCVDTNEATIVLTKLHKWVGGSHFSVEITIRIFLDARDWWLSFYEKNLHFCKSCYECKKIGNLTFSIITKPMITLLSNPFMKWQLNFIGPMKSLGRYNGINTFWWRRITPPNGWKQGCYIPTQWLVMTKFLYECILTKFGCLLTLVSN